MLDIIVLATLAVMIAGCLFASGFYAGKARQNDGELEMTFTTYTLAEAERIAEQCRALFMEDGYTVEIVHPLFDGDVYRINVGTN